MTQQTINIGVVANDGTGDDLRVAMQKINDNFNELYVASPITSIITIEGNTISTTASNANLELTASGTGGIIVADAGGTIGFFGTSPVAQQSAIAFDPLANDGSTVDDLRQVINQMLVVLRNYGIIAS